MLADHVRVPQPLTGVRREQSAAVLGQETASRPVPENKFRYLNSLLQPAIRYSQQEINEERRGNLTARGLKREITFYSQPIKL